MIWFLDFRGRDVGGPVLPGRVVNPAGLGDPAATAEFLAVQLRVVFLVHGFNVSRPSGQEKLAAFASRLTFDEDRALVAVTWSGDSSIGPVSYPLEGNNADDTGAELAAFIQRTFAPGTELSFVSHSLGARVVFETLKGLSGDQYSIGQVCVMAAAIDDFSVSEPQIYSRQVTSAARVAVLASERDNVLRWAFPLGDLIQSFIFFWKDVSGLALGYHGPRPGRFDPIPSNVKHVQIPTNCGVDHGDYLFAGAPGPLAARAVRFADLVVRGEPSPDY